MDEVGKHVKTLEKELGKKFGDEDDPLLVSVRSGAAVSMPGMMNTIRTAKRMQARAEPMQRSAPSVKDDEDET